MAKDKPKKWNWDLFDGSKTREQVQNTERATNNEPPQKSDNEKINEIIARITPLIEQVNTLYNQYKTGIEKKPPNERRSLLDDLINQIQNMPKPTPNSRFQAQSLLSKYITYKDRWDRMMKEIEQGGATQRGRR